MLVGVGGLVTAVVVGAGVDVSVGVSAGGAGLTALAFAQPHSRLERRTTRMAQTHGKRRQLLFEFLGFVCKYCRFMTVIITAAGFC